MTALPDTFIAKTATDTGCVIWLGAVNNKGYGCFAIDGRSQLAHRVAYEAMNGPIPDGLTIDHLCRVRNCVNPSHLEAVTVGENNRRARALDVGGECGRGHRIESESDLYVAPRGRHECRACRRNAKARHSARAMEAAS